MNASDRRTETARPHTPAVRKPDFFIIGAPKAGTTSLYSYLAAHPQIFMPRLKEPLYFCSDMSAYREKATLVRDEDEYLQHFAGATPDHLAVGEASSLYLFSEVSAPAILEFNPLARFIVMLRNPVDLVHSFHSQLVFGLHESVSDFEQAWNLQELRAQGEHIPPDCLAPRLLQYRQMGMLGEQVARLLEGVPREQVTFLLFDDLVAEPRRQYEEVLDFLGVPPDYRCDFPTANANKIRRSDRLTWHLRHPPFPLNVLRRAYLRRFGGDSWPVRAVASLNRKAAPRAPLTAAMRRELESTFYDDLRTLEQLTGQCLRHWLPPYPHKAAHPPAA